MKNKEILTAVFEQFDASAKKFNEDTNGLYYETSQEYKGEEVPENLKYRFAKIYYNSYTVKFVYISHGIMGTVNSVIGCYISLDKKENSIEIPLPLLTDYCNFDTTAPMFIPYITNENGLSQAFNCIGNVLKDLQNEIRNISYDSEYKKIVLKKFTDEMNYIFNIDNFADIADEARTTFYDFFAVRFTSAAFINIINGNNSKAIKQLKKIKRPTGYETRVISQLLSGKESDSSSISSVTANVSAYNKLGVQKTDLKEFLALFLSWLIITPVTSIVFVGWYLLLVWIEGSESVFLMGPNYNLPFCICFGFFTAIVLSYFTRHKFYKILNKKGYENYLEIDSIQNSGGSDKFMKAFLAIIFTGCMILCVLLARWNINFKSDGFIDNSEFFTLRGTYYSYNEIDCIYYKSERINDFGDVLSFPSYVLKLKSGKEIDFYEFAEITDYEKELFSYLNEKNVTIEIITATNN